MKYAAIASAFAFTALNAAHAANEVGDPANAVADMAEALVREIADHIEETDLGMLLDSALTEYNAKVPLVEAHAVEPNDVLVLLQSKDRRLPRTPYNIASAIKTLVEELDSLNGPEEVNRLFRELNQPAKVDTAPLVPA